MRRPSVSPQPQTSYPSQPYTTVVAECRICTFWKTTEVIADVVGHCRRYPPLPAAEGERPIFPKTAPGDWCGEFLQR